MDQTWVLHWIDKIQYSAIHESDFERLKMHVSLVTFEDFYLVSSVSVLECVMSCKKGSTYPRHWDGIIFVSSLCIFYVERCMWCIF